MDETPVTRPHGAVDRRMLLTLGVGAFLVATMPRARAGRRAGVRRRFPVMGTLAEVVALHADRGTASAAVTAAADALHATDRLMSRFRADSDVGRINALATRRTVRIDAETAAVLEQALAWARRSAGRFDPCLGRASALWDVKHRRIPPAARELRAVAGGGLWQALALDVDSQGGAVRLADERAAVDLGGIAKGHGVDRAVAALRRHGIRDGLVNVGGDLYALGRSEDGDAWSVGVRDPSDPRRILRTLRLEDRAVATSGDYEQFFDHDGRRYHHLLDARTAAPVRSPRHSATVVAATCLAADAEATARFASV